jgi:NADPH2:quinone reductase
MKAWLLDSLTGIQGLRQADVPDPHPAVGQVVLKLEFAALNPADRYLAEGQYPARPALPHILGRDGIGIVTAVGEGVSDTMIGRKLCVLRGAAGVTEPGTFAEQVAVSAGSLVTIPSGWSDQEAAGATLVYLTAYQALTMWSDLPPAALVLISGASGGVGVAGVQLAKAMGHQIIALSRDAAKSARLRQIGADYTADPTDANWRKLMLEQTAGRRVDLAIDNIGGTFLPDMIETLADHGRVSCVGRLAGPVPQFNTASLFFRRLKLGGVAVGAYTAAEGRAAWMKVVEFLSLTGAKPLVDSVHPFVDLPKAFARLTAGPMGKVLLAIGA